MERDISYQHPPMDAIDMHAIHHAATRNGSGQLYIDAFGSLETVPQSVQDAVPNADLSGPLFDGTAGFQWNQHEIKKTDNTIEWFVNGLLLITLDAEAFVDSTGGNNILFGHWDVNFSSSTDANKEELIFTLIDNIEVLGIPEPTAIIQVSLGLLLVLGSRMPFKTAQ